jgi:hypothetical protein
LTKKDEKILPSDPADRRSC